MKWYEFWGQPRVLFVICFIAFVACAGCKTTDGWHQDEVDWVVVNV